jgi:heme-degrading monooxygenase HmoA
MSQVRFLSGVPFSSGFAAISIRRDCDRDRVLRRRHAAAGAWAFGGKMFIAMNRFRIVKGREAEFEGIWADRDSHLDGVPGFEGFDLLRGPGADDHTLYASHSVWRSRRHFEDWTKSEAFRKAHANAGTARDIYQGPPEFEGFETVS